MRIIAVSDVHLGYKKWSWRELKWMDNTNSKDFESFLDDLDKRINEDDITDFVLLGDIMDFWRSQDIDIILEYKGILSKLKILTGKVNLHYIVGNHDYYILKLKKMYPKYYPFDVKKSVRLGEGENKFSFIHGHQLAVVAKYEPLRIDDYEKISEKLCSFENYLGRLASWVYNKYERRALLKPPGKRKDESSRVKQLALSEVRDILLGLPEGDKLIFGHTHEPFNSDVAANTGSWLKEVDAKDQNTYIEIKDDKVELKRFLKREET